MMILTDLDDVVLHWAKGFIHHMGSEGHDLTNAHDDFNKWINSNERFRSENLIDAFNEHEKFAHLEPYTDAYEVINRLYQQGHTFTAISAVEYTEHSWQYRKANLDRYFPGVFTSIFHVGLRPHSKRQMLSVFKPTIWVEDNVTNAMDGGELGHTSFLINRPYNENIESPLFERVSSWYEVEKYINGSND